MNLNQPAWIKQIKKEKEIPDQITIISGPIGANRSCYTGAGVDGIIQPGKMAGQVHEGEGVINANAMQNLDPEEFQALQSSLESGQLNKNAFRASIGLPPVQGYATGGIVDPLKNQNATSPLELPTGTLGATPVNGGTEASKVAGGSVVNSTLDLPTQTLGANNAASSSAKNQAGTSNTLLPGLSKDDSNLVMNNARNQATGKAYEPFDIAQTEILSKAARNLQATNANAVAKAGLTGQGAATEMIKNTNQGLMENLSSNLLDRATQKQDMMNTGTNQLLNIGQQVESFNQLNKIDTGKRINTLIAGGNDLSSITNDTMLRNQIAKDLGVDVNGQTVTNEIQTLYNASVDTNADTYGGDAEKLLQDYVNSGKTVNDAMQDKNLFRKTALSMRLNPDDTANAEAINAEIKNRFEDASLNDVDRAFKNITDSGLITDEVKSVSGWENDLKGMVRDLATKGYIDPETGGIKEGAVVEWPWEDPDTYFKYNDWNGNEVTDSNYNQATPIDVTDNGTTYKNANGQAVTQADANAQWEKLNPDEKELYFNTEKGTFDRQTFLDKFFRTTQGANGETVAVTTRNAFDDKLADKTYAGKMGDAIDSWSTTEVYPGDPAKDGTAGDPIGADQFLFYDKYGNAQVESKEKGKLGYIWQQLSDKYNNGTLLSTAQFKGLWSEGKGWYVDDDGTITNLDTKGNNTVTLNKANELYGTWSSGSRLLESEAAALSSQWDKLPADKKATPTPFDFNKEQMTYWNDGSGKNRWSMKGDVTEWVSKNVGRLWKDEKSGRVYEIRGQNNPNDRKSTATIKLVDITTGHEVEFVNSTNGKALPQEVYNG